MIRIDDFSFRYSQAKRFALENINMEIGQGEFVLISGDSGSGKSTLLRAINGLIPHFYSGEYCGKVRAYGMDVFQVQPREIARYIGTVFQDPENQVLMSTVEREIAFPLENAGMGGKDIEMRLEDTLELAGIADLRDRKTSELSGGELQKVAIASAMALYPRALVLDEPTSQLDPKSAEEIISLLGKLNEEIGTTIIIAEHRVDRLLPRVDRLMVLNRGKIVADGEPHEIASRLNLEKMGVELPQVSRVAKRVNAQRIPLTVKEAWDVLEDALKKARVDEREIGEDMKIRMKKVRFSYGARRVLSGVNLEVRGGETLAIIGRNGSGKTTLAKIMAGILKPSGGRVIQRAKDVGMVFQNPALHIVGESVYEDIAYTLRARGMKEGERVERVMRMLGIDYLRDRNPLDLSGGEKLMFAIGTVMVAEPDVLILDEPTRGLSWRYKMRLVEIIREYSKSHGVVVISHDMDLIARVAHRVALLSSGRVVVEGPARDVLTGTLSYSTQLNRLAWSHGLHSKILTEEDLS